MRGRIARQSRRAGADGGAMAVAAGGFLRADWSHPDSAGAQRASDVVMETVCRCCRRNVAIITAQIQ